MLPHSYHIAELSHPLLLPCLGDKTLFYHSTERVKPCVAQQIRPSSSQMIYYHMRQTSRRLT